MKNLCLPFFIASLAGCIWQQTGIIRNVSDNTVFVGHAGGSTYSKIEPGQTSESKFVFCVEVAEGNNTRYFGVPQHAGMPPPNVPSDAYQKGGRLYDVNLVITEDGMFYESPSKGLVPVTRFEENCASEIG